MKPPLLNVVVTLTTTFWATVRKIVCSTLSVCLSVTLVYCGQTVGWIKMKLDTEVGLDRGHIV